MAVNKAQPAELWQARAEFCKAWARIRQKIFLVKCKPGCQSCAVRSNLPTRKDSWHAARKHLCLGDRVCCLDTHEDALSTQERVCHALDFCTELLATKGVSAPTYKAFVERFNERAVVDVVALMGAYHTTSALFRVERYPLPPGKKEEIPRPM